MFQSDIASVLDDAKAWSDTGGNMLNSWPMNLQISQGEYTLFWALIYCGLRALVESLKRRKIFEISERNVQIIAMMGS